jgi:molybdopterin-containing oxidoreductase family molybdopterin binding subunit
VEEHQKKQLEETEEQVFSCMCVGNCQSRCRLYVHVRDGKAVKISMAPFPDPRYNRICLRGISHLQRIYDPTRIKYPMKRVGERGEDKWERISWDEAIDTIATKWKAYQEEYGKQSVAFSTLSGDMAMINGLYSVTRMAHMMGATLTESSLDMGDTFGLGRVIGNMGTFNQRNDPADLANASTVLVWAANPIDSHPHDWRFIAEAQEAGGKVVVIDPRFTATAAKADQFIPIRPGSDAALALAMAEAIIAENLMDTDYLRDHTVAPFLVRDDTKRFLRQSHLSGIAPEPGQPDPYIVWDPETKAGRILAEVAAPALEGTFTIEGINVSTAFTVLKEFLTDYTPEKASALCEVEPDVIRDIARLYAGNKPASIYNGFIQYDNGLQTGHAWGILASLTGNIARKGASLGHCGRAFYSCNLLPYLFPRGMNSPVIPWIYLPEVLKSGKFKGKPHPIKSIYFSCSNAVTNNPDQKKIINEILASIEFIVVADIVHTDTTKYADMILPVAHWFEVMEFVQGPDQPNSTLSEKALEPAFESKGNMDIFRLLGTALGYGEHFKYTDEEFIKMLIDTDLSRSLGLTWERLQKEKVIQTLPSCWINWEGDKFPTPSGRLEFYLENPQPRIDCGIPIDQDRERLPIFTPPVEAWPDNPLMKKYPLIYHTDRVRWRLHSQWQDSGWLRELDPEPTVKIHPQDAASRGIKTGDMVEIFNDRGHVVLKAILSEGVRPGMVSVPKGWRRDQFKEGSYQELTHDRINYSSYNLSFYDVVCEVRKV